MLEDKEKLGATLALVEVESDIVAVEHRVDELLVLEL
jgi:hypothetical protein